MEEYTLTIFINTYEGKGNLIITEQYETHEKCRKRAEDISDILDKDKVHSVGYKVEKSSIVGSDEFKF